jgi:hypothetical protein
VLKIYNEDVGMMYKFFSAVVCILFLVSSFWHSQNLAEFIDIHQTERLFQWTNAWDSLVDVLIRQQETTWWRRWIILHFCDAVLRTRSKIDSNAVDLPRFWFDIDNFKYDPRQSLIMYTLCVNLDETSQWRKILWIDYQYRNYKEIFEEVEYPESRQPVSLDVTRMWKDDIEHNQVWGIPRQSALDWWTAFSWCNPAHTMQACDFSWLMPRIFKNIMNDYTNIKTASIYWYMFQFDEDPEWLDKAVTAFSHSYFKDPISLNAPCNYRDMPYLSNTSTEGMSRQCSHPETRKLLENYIKSAESFIEMLKFLDHEWIMDPFDDHDASKHVADYCNNTNNRWTSPKHLLHACAFSNWWDVSFDSDRIAYKNLLANELMRYSLFLDYYSNRIITNSWYAPARIWSVELVLRQNLKEVKNIWFEKVLAQSAISTSLRMLTNLAVSFPSYIALKAYEEDILNYRDVLVQTYTPAHQLFYTFRNVQSCNEEWY